MSNSIHKILDQQDFSKEDILFLLNTKSEERQLLFLKASVVKEKYIGNKVHLRGLIELSNNCLKNCLYCGIRKDNLLLKRYELSIKEALIVAEFAFKNKYGSIVIQTGEKNDTRFIKKIDTIIKEIKILSDNLLGITLSLGEQTEDTYKKWFESGAHRYLLRIETSNPALYSKIHPNNNLHSIEKRISCLNTLKKIGYQIGSGVMVGLPFQTIEDLADDILFMKKMDIDMCGMGPYLEHSETPLFEYSNQILPLKERFDLTLKMIAILRILMKDINIASTNALQSIDKIGREKALKVGANIIMPNITPIEYRKLYFLYQNKPCIDEDAEECKECLEARIKFSGNEIEYDKWGDSIHFMKNLNK